MRPKLAATGAVGALPWLAILTAVLPVLAAHASLLLAIRGGHIPPCLPYVDGCASISATGRNLPASLVFKPLLTSQWLLLCAYWLANARWLALLREPRPQRATPERIMATLGCCGALALVVYVTYLGTKDPFYEFMRRFGIYLYFLLTTVALVMLASITRRLARLRGLARLARLAGWQFTLCLVPVALGLMNVYLKATLDNADRSENIIEWLAALAMQLAIGVSAWHWHLTGYRLDGRLAERDREGSGWSG